MYRMEFVKSIFNIHERFYNIHDILGYLFSAHSAHTSIDTHAILHRLCILLLK